MRLTRVYVGRGRCTAAARGLVGAARPITSRACCVSAPAMPLTLFDGRAASTLRRIELLRKDAVRVAIGEHARVERESPLDVTLAQGVSRGERMDWVMQKATELGVRRIVPLITAQKRRASGCAPGREEVSALARHRASPPASNAAAIACPNLLAPIDLAGISGSAARRPRTCACCSLAGRPRAHQRSQAWQEDHGADWTRRRTCAGGVGGASARFRRTGPRILRTETAHAGSPPQTVGSCGSVVRLRAIAVERMFGLGVRVPPGHGILGDAPRGMRLGARREDPSGPSEPACRSVPSSLTRPAQKQLAGSRRATLAASRGYRETAAGTIRIVAA